MRIMDQAHVVSAVPYEVEESFAWDEEARRAEAAKGRGPRTRLPGAQALPKATISVQDVVLRLRTPQDRLGASPAPPPAPAPPPPLVLSGHAASLTPY